MEVGTQEILRQLESSESISHTINLPSSLVVVVVVVVVVVGGGGWN